LDTNFTLSLVTDTVLYIVNLEPFASINVWVQQQGAFTLIIEVSDWVEITPPTITPIATAWDGFKISNGPGDLWGHIIAQNLYEVSA
jgi:hypothetical protein